MTKAELRQRVEAAEDRLAQLVIAADELEPDVPGIGAMVFTFDRPFERFRVTDLQRGIDGNVIAVGLENPDNGLWFVTTLAMVVPPSKAGRRR